jgi:hypothetical protein
VAFNTAFGGFIAVSEHVTFNFGGPFYCQQFVSAICDGSIEFPVPGSPSWVNAGAVQGYRGVGCYKYGGSLNGVVYTQGQSASWLPGNVAGFTVSGGQYG